MTRPVVRLGPAARRDLTGHVRWLRTEVDAQTAARFAASASATFRKIADVPGLGAPTQARSPQLAGARRWRVDGFPHHLIFYLPVGGGIRVLRVLHAAQNWKA